MNSKNPHGFVPSCTVVICTRDRPTELNRCLEAVTRLDYPRFDVLVVDNAPGEARARDVARRWDAGYLVEPVPGLSRARNHGARASQTEVVAYLDDDGIPEPDWLSRLVSEFWDPMVMAVAGRICFLSEGTLVFQLDLMQGPPHECLKHRAVDCETPNWFEMANFGGLGSGGNMAFRRSVFDVWEGFDVRLGRGAILDGGEEDYAFFRLIDLGYRVVFVPDAVVRHPAPQTEEELRRELLRHITTSVGYMTLLLFEEAPYRRATLHYIMQAFQRTPRPWRTHQSEYRSLPRWRTALAAIWGPLLYAKARLINRDHNRMYALKPIGGGGTLRVGVRGTNR